MAKKIQLAISEPCHENWEHMHPSEKGKFCDACQKQVIDFSNMSDFEVAQFFKKPSTGSVCGRFMNDQLNRPIELPRKRIPWIKYFFQFLIPAFIVSIKASSQNTRMGKPTIKVQPQKPVTGDTIILPEFSIPEIKQEAGIALEGLKVNASPAPPNWSQFTGKLGGVSVGFIFTKPGFGIKGEILDEDDRPVPFASVIIAGSKTGVQADENGNFSIEMNRKWEKMELVVSSVGYEEKNIELVRKEIENDLTITLTAKTTLAEVVVVAYPLISCRSYTMGAVSTIHGKTIIAETEAEKKPEPNAFTIYPNPAKPGTYIQIATNRFEEGTYDFEFLSMTGNLVNKKQLWMDKTARVLELPVPMLTPGTYILRISNKKLNNISSQKIIIQ